MRRLAALTLALALAVTGCGDDDTDEGVRAGADASTTTTTTSAGPAAYGDSKDLKVKPTVTVPSAPAPKTLQIEDVVVGGGATAESGKPVTVHYVGVSYSTGKQFDASWDSGNPFPFTLGKGDVIPGWDQGVVGMKVGGRRRLTIPPDLAYGAQGFPPVIAPNETLVFVIDLLAVG